MKVIFHYCLALLLWLSGTCAECLADQGSDQFKWTSVGDLAVARAGHTATLLHNGKVLIAGGHGSAGDLTSTELYNPETAVFTQIADLNSGRTGHTATLLPDGQVLVTGGQFNGQALISAELYNPETGQWTPTGNLHVGRVYHTATLLPNGMVLVVGGSRAASPPLFSQGAPPGSASDNAELYDPALKKWMVTDSLHVARYSHAATLLANGQVLVTGGTGKEGLGHPVSASELYNPVIKKWTTSGDLLTPRFGHDTILLPTEKVLITGGASNLAGVINAELYNPGNGTVSLTGRPHRATGTAVLLSDGRVLLVGASDESGALTNAELYTPSTGKWEPTANSNIPHFESTTTLLPDGTVLVVGGNSGHGSPSNNLKAAELFGPKTKSKQELAPPTPVAINNPPPVPSPATHPLVTVAILAVILATCLVIFTACVVILVCACIVFSLVRNWRK